MLKKSIFATRSSNKGQRVVLEKQIKNIKVSEKWDVLTEKGYANIPFLSKHTVLTVLGVDTESTPTQSSVLSPSPRCGYNPVCSLY